MPVEVRKISLVGPKVNPDCAADFIWDIALDVIGAVPKGIIDLRVTFSDPEMDPANDIVLEEMEIDGDSLRPGKNALRIEHDGVELSKILEFMDSDKVQCALMFDFEYQRPDSAGNGNAATSSSSSAATPKKADNIFHRTGIQVNFMLRDGIQLEDVERLSDDPSLIVREVRDGSWNTPYAIQWDVEDDEEQTVVAPAADEKENVAPTTAASISKPATAVPDATTATITPTAAAADAEEYSFSDEEEFFQGSDDEDDGAVEKKKLRSE